ncbi:DUF429 domain-containing protein [Spirochaeta dissipatitropha]
MNAVTGIDAAGGGWVIATISEQKDWDIDFVVSPRDSRMHSHEIYIPSKLVEYIVRSTLTFIDMPVGLVSGDLIRENNIDPEMAQHREFAVRRMLVQKLPKSARSIASIFPVPVAEAVYTEDYAKAREVNKEIIGKSISKQSWNLVYRIKQIQAVIELLPGIVGNLLESHPETIFRLLYSRYSDVPLPSKSSQEGIDARLNMLEDQLPGARDAFNITWDHLDRGTRIQKDDILDAMILAVDAMHSAEKGLVYTAILGDGEVEELPMELHKFPARELGGSIHSRRKDKLLRADFADAIPRGVRDVPLCIVYYPLDLSSASR